MEQLWWPGLAKPPNSGFSISIPRFPTVRLRQLWTAASAGPGQGTPQEASPTENSATTVAKDARKKLGPGKITFLHDKAPPYQAILHDNELASAPHFDGGLRMAAGKAPDMSHLDQWTRASARSLSARLRMLARSQRMRSARQPSVRGRRLLLKCVSVFRSECAATC